MINGDFHIFLFYHLFYSYKDVYFIDFICHFIFLYFYNFSNRMIFHEFLHYCNFQITQHLLTSIIYHLMFVLKCF